MLSRFERQPDLEGYRTVSNHPEDGQRITHTETCARVTT